MQSAFEVPWKFDQMSVINPGRQSALREELEVVDNITHSMLLTENRRHGEKDQPFDGHNQSESELHPMEP